MKAPLEVFGYAGMVTRRPLDDQRWLEQRWVSAARTVQFDGTCFVVEATIRFDDSCDNGHNSFSITGRAWAGSRAGEPDCGGCIHDLIEAAFPDLAPLIPFHLNDARGPMHYITNTLYLASYRDYRGLKKGEPYAWTQGVRFGSSPITVPLSDAFAAWLKDALDFREKAPADDPNRPSLEIVEVPHVKAPHASYQFPPKYTLGSYGGGIWHKSPFNTRREAEEFSSALLGSYTFLKIPTMFSEGKERELAAARAAANWPEATDEQLCLPRDELKALLEARLPGLNARFRETLERAGLLWAPAEEGASA